MSLLAGAAVIAFSHGAAAAEAVETVVVTGSLIQQTGGDAPTPTVVVDSDTIAKTGQPNIAAVLTQLPQVQNAGGLGDLSPLNSNFLTSGFGVSNVDLRSLGSARTLVLINGRRQVAGSPTGSSVDLNTVPTQLISRVEVITGGSSAAYGSDAVAGVVNIILKDDFEGLLATAQGGSSSRDDGGDAYAALTLGSNFANGPRQRHDFGERRTQRRDPLRQPRLDELGRDEFPRSLPALRQPRQCPPGRRRVQLVRPGRPLSDRPSGRRR
ncbi:MAG: TonB-dependent receptor plug domain-containing protein [Rhizomicrobium sp.]